MGGEKRGKGEGDGAVLWLPTQWAAQTAVSESKKLCSIQALFCQESLFVRKPSHNIWLVVCGCVCKGSVSLSLSLYLPLSVSLRQRQTDRDRQAETDRYRQKQTETDRETERQADTYRNSSPPGTVSLLERKKERKKERKAFGCGTSLSKEFCANRKQCPIPFPLSPFLTMGRPAAQQPAHG